MTTIELVELQNKCFNVHSVTKCRYTKCDSKKSSIKTFDVLTHRRVWTLDFQFISPPLKPKKFIVTN